ncbi:MAG: fused MFS/spermidine synthase [Actinomycetota bacterium]
MTDTHASHAEQHDSDDGLSQGEPPHGERLRFPGVYAFVGSGCLLVLELVAGRILAPTIGVSLYTWTSIIGVVLAGISLGNWLGGRIADRAPGRATLSSLYLLSALTSALILAFSRDLGKIAAPHTWPAITQVLWLTTLLFFIPSTLLGTMTPMLIKLSLRSLGATGRVVGRIQAAATLGSIVGTFLTGFFLISWFGTRAIVAGVSGALLVLGAFSNPIWTRRSRMTVAAVVLFIAGMAALSKSPCLVESNYFCISIEKVQGGEILVLNLDHLDHGHVDTKDPTNLIYPYQILYQQVLDTWYPRGTRVDSFQIGGGAYTTPRYLERYYTGRQVVAEIDPAVTEFAHDRLFLSRDTTVETISDDARQALKTLGADEQFDVVLGDAFNDAAIPYHLTTVEFNALLKTHMRPDGVYMINVVDGVEYAFLRSFMLTLREVFYDVRLMTLPGLWPLDPKGGSTFVVAASDRPLPDVPSMVPRDEVDAYLDQEGGSVLIDDHVPVDQLLTPNFRRRLER